MECEKTSSNLTAMLLEINCQIAQFRDLLIHIGHDKHDSPELRISIRKTRRSCVEQCLKVAELILPQMKRYVTGLQHSRGVSREHFCF